MPSPKIYRATELASIYSPVKPLVGSRKAAQAYADRVTTSEWWEDHCPGYYEFESPPPPRIWIWQGDPDTGGFHDPSILAILKNEEIPSITLGLGAVNGNTPAIADKWVILHELAHVMTNLVEGDGHHGKQFCLSYFGLVRRFLGPVATRNLIHWSRVLGIRLNYGLLQS